MKYDDFIIGQYYCFTKEHNEEVIKNKYSINSIWHKHFINNLKGLKLLYKGKSSVNNRIKLKFENIDGDAWTYEMDSFQKSKFHKNIERW